MVLFKRYLAQHKTVHHINNHSNDNRISNLREASSAEQNQQRRVFAKSKSSISGITWDEKSQKWRVGFVRNGAIGNFGFFELEDAKRVLTHAKATFNPPPIEPQVKTKSKKNTHFDLKRLLTYHKDSGWFTRNIITNPVQKINERVGSQTKGEYKNLHIGDHSYLEHILAFFYVNGYWPPKGMIIDHNDGHKYNNKWNNLILRTKSENAQKKKKQINNKYDNTGIGLGRTKQME